MASDAVTTRASKKKVDQPASAQERRAAAMVAQAREQGLALTGPDGLLKQLTKTVLKTALGAEMSEHLGHAKHADQPGGGASEGVGAGVVVAEAVGAAAAVGGEHDAGLVKRCATTWNRADAASAGRGRYPSSSMPSRVGPAKKRMV